MKISDMSEQSGLPVDTLRYYEKVGLLRLRTQQLPSDIPVLFC